MFDSLIIGSPKRKRHLQSKWNKFFPYYAGFPESFARTIIESSTLPRGGLVFDPWNGSGTTTYAAAQLGYSSYGIDLNPVMVLVARARNLAPSEADSIEPQAKSLVQNIARLKTKVSPDDPLLQWLTIDTASFVRNLEHRIRSRLISKSLRETSVQFDKISCFAATFYVALFTVFRNFTKSFRSSNPTWLRLPKNSEPKIAISITEISSAFMDQVKSMAESLQNSTSQPNDAARINISVGNTTQLRNENFADLILTSPPYCTRIDYTAATRIELAIINPLLSATRETLSKEMIGSVKVPTDLIEPQAAWGTTCIEFLDRLMSHDSKASRGYYYKTHLDYFNKMSRSIKNIHSCLKKSATAILVVQDSHYKEIHNDVPLILTEMAENSGLSLFRREDFSQKNSIAGINSKSRKYRETAVAVESVICFRKKQKEVI